MKVYVVYRYDCDCPYVIKATLDEKEAEDIKWRYSDAFSRAIVGVLDTDAPPKKPIWNVQFFADGVVMVPNIDDSFMYSGFGVLNKPDFRFAGSCSIKVEAETDIEAIKLASAIRQKAVEEKEAE